MKILRRQSDFEKIKTYGKRFSHNQWLLLSGLASNEHSEFRYGWTISSKVGKAVLRNKFKRWCRVFFKHKTKDANQFGLDIHVLFRPVNQEFYRKLTHKEFDDCLDKNWQKLSKHFKISQHDSN